MEIEAYLEQLASAAPTPGGGSAATLVGALGAALCAMVARITMASPKHASVRDDAAAVAKDADELRARFLAAGPDDERAYAAVVSARALPRDTSDEKDTRNDALQAALAGAAEAPLAVAAMAGDGFALAERTAALANLHLSSDIVCALAFFRATLDASGSNVSINHKTMTDDDMVIEQTRRYADIVSAANAAERSARNFFEDEAE